MSETLDRQMAESNYRKFVNELYSLKASRDAIDGTPDRPPRPQANVSRSDALDCFLKKNPKFERFREQLSEFRSEQPTFSFDEASWKQAKT